MRRNCNLELRFVKPSVSYQSMNFDSHQRQPMMDLLSGSPNDQKQQQMTIFYNGRISVCNVTELQAREIMLHASNEMEKSWNPCSSQPPSPILLQSQLYSPPPTTGLSMKRSLQRFLQKRKCRIQATSPYNH